jgi:hypothetical protein
LCQHAAKRLSFRNARSTMGKLRILQRSVYRMFYHHDICRVQDNSLRRLF